MPSMSRMRTAIWARFAASATRFRSRMKTSVPDVFVCVEAGGCVPDWADVALLLDVDACCCADDVLGASIFFGVLSSEEIPDRVLWGWLLPKRREIRVLSKEEI